MPTPRDYASLESPTQGNVLWAPLDRGITRIGYVFTPEQEAACDSNLTEQIVVREAIASIRPFKMEYEAVNWWTLYIIGQQVASTYQPHPQILLTGDTCHIHSSGAAQGLNTGIQDAINLGWKLALVCKGLAKDSLLATYEVERRAAALRLIEFDRKISSLMANKWPEGLPESPDQDINEIVYTENLINSQPENGKSDFAISPGHRAPDAGLLKVGTLQRVRLQSATPNRACIYVVAFAGDPRMIAPSIASFHSYLKEAGSFTSIFSRDLVQVITVATVANTRFGAEEALGVLPYGSTYFDDNRQAHRRYGVNLRNGALIVLRPDGYVGLAAGLSKAGGQLVATYLDQSLIKI